jgi:hypothetical protein
MNIPTVRTQAEMDQFNQERARLKQTLIDAGVWKVLEAWLEQEAEAGAPAGPLMSAAAEGLAVFLASVVYRFPPAENATDDQIVSAVMNQFMQIYAHQCQARARERAAAAIIKEGLNS